MVIDGASTKVVLLDLELNVAPGGCDGFQDFDAFPCDLGTCREESRTVQSTGQSRALKFCRNAM